MSDISQRQHHQDDKLFYVRPLIDLLAEHSKIMYNPGEHLSIPNIELAHQMGHKMWVVADAEMAYIC